MQSLGNLNSSTPLKFAQLPSMPSLVVKTLSRSPELIYDEWAMLKNIQGAGKSPSFWDISLWPFPSKQVASSVLKKKKNVAYVLFVSSY